MEEKVMVEEEGFTFRKFFNLVKKSAKRILIYAIIAAVIGIGLAAVVGVFTIDDKVYSSTVEFTHRGIEKGLAPDGTVLDYNVLKSPAVVNAALEEMGYKDNAALVSSVEDALTITPYVSDAIAKKIAEDPTYEYVPSKYVISIVAKSVSGLKNSHYQALLNKVVEKAREYFKQAYKYEVEAVDVIGSSALKVTPDYYDLICAYKAEIKSLRAMLDAMPDYYSTVTTKLKADIGTLEAFTSTLENYILVNNVQKVGASMLLKTNLTNRKSECEINSETYGAQIQELSNTIQNYNQLFESLIVDANDKITVTGVDASVYNGLVTKKERIISLKAECDGDAKIYEQKIALVSSNFCTQEHRQYVEQRFEEIYSDYTSTVSYVNKELSDYTDVYVMKTGVRTVNTASASSAFGWIAVIATVAVCLVVGISAAIVVTSVKLKKQEKKND